MVFDSGEEHYWMLYVAGYGLSLVVSASTIIASIVQGGWSEGLYFREDACWLDGDYIWAFRAPVIGVLAFNTVILAIGLFKAYQVD